MRRLMCALLLVVLLTPVMGSAVQTGDPLDTNDGAAVDFYCFEAGYDGCMSPAELAACGIAMQQEQGGWWDWPW